MYHYLDKDFQVRGPLTQEQVVLLLDSGTIHPTTKVAGDGATEWKALAEHAEFAEAIADLQTKSYGNCPICNAALFGWTVPPQCPHCSAHLTTTDSGNLWQQFVLAFRRPFTFKGRSTRMEFWSFVLFSFILSYVAQMVYLMLMIPITSILGVSTDTVDDFSTYSFATGFILLTGLVLVCLSQVVVYFPGIALQVRRLHDCGYSGWWLFFGLFAMFLPFISFIWITEPTIFFTSYILLSLIVLIPWVVLAVSGFKDSERGNNKYGPSIKYPRG